MIYLCWLFFFLLEGADYISINKIVNFQSGETLKNITITILDDTYVEGTEYFILEIEAIEEVVTFSIRETVVAIQDNDSMIKCLLMYVRFHSVYIYIYIYQVIGIEVLNWNHLIPILTSSQFLSSLLNFDHIPIHSLKTPIRSIGFQEMLQFHVNFIL